jgi:hypothetical protein
MKVDLNDTMQREGPEGVRARSDGAKVHRLHPETVPPIKLSDWIAREDLKEPEKLLGALFTTTCRVIIAGPTGLGKTMFGLAAAFAITRKEGFGHWIAERPGRVLYVDGEMPRPELRRRLISNYRAGDSDALSVLSREDFEDLPPLNEESGQIWMDRFIATHGPFSLIIFDNIQSLLSGNMKDEELWSGVMPWVKGLTRRQMGQIWFHHTGHDESRSYGSKAKEWGVDTVILMKGAKVPDADLAFTLEFTKSRMRTPENKEDFQDVTLVLKGGNWNVVVGKPEIDRLTKNQQTFFGLLEDAAAEAHGKGVALDEWNRRAREASIGVRRPNDLIDLRKALLAKKKVYTFNDLWFVTKTNP